MNWWLRRLLADYRAEYGCPPADRQKSDEDFEEPCRLCRLVDAVLSDKFQRVEWASDNPLVGELDDATLMVEQTTAGWSWRVEKPGPKFTTAVAGEGVEKGLMDALYAAERCLKDS